MYMKVFCLKRSTMDNRVIYTEVKSGPPTIMRIGYVPVKSLVLCRNGAWNSQAIVLFLHFFEKSLQRKLNSHLKLIALQLNSLGDICKCEYFVS